MALLLRLEAGLVSLLLLAPLVFLPVLVGGFRDYAFKPAAACVLLAAGLTLMRRMLRDERPAGSPGPAGSQGLDRRLLLLLIWMGTSSALSSTPALSLAAWERVLIAGMAYWLVRDRLLRGIDVRALGGLAALLGTATAIYGILEVRTGHEHVLWSEKVAYRGHVTGTFINHAHFSSFLFAGLGALLGLALPAGWRLRIALLVPGAAILAGIAMSKARGAWVALAAAWLLTTLVATGSRRLASLRSMLLASGLFAGLGLAALAHHGPELGERFATLAPDRVMTVQSSFWNRLRLWRATLGMIARDPVLGVGAGNWRTSFFHHRPRGHFDEPTHVHNELLQLTAEAGVPATLLALSILGTILRMGWARTGGSSLESASGCWGALFAFLAILIHATGEFTLHSPAIAAWALVMAAILTAGPGRGPEDPGTRTPDSPPAVPGPARSPRGGAWLAALVIAGLAGSTATILLRQGIGDGFALRGQLLEKHSRLREALDAYHRGLDLGAPDPAIGLRLARCLEEAADLMRTIGARPQARELAREAELVTEVLTRRIPGDPEAWSLRGRLGLLAARLDPDHRDGAIAVALEGFENAARADPHHWVPYVRLANLLHGLGRLDEASRCYRIALANYPLEHIGIFPDILDHLAPWRSVFGGRDFDRGDLRLALEIFKIRSRRAPPGDYRPGRYRQVLASHAASLADGEAMLREILDGP